MTLTELLQKSARDHSNKTAIIFGQKKWNYNELHETTITVASGFQEQGIKEGDRVALLLKNSPEFIFTVFALSHLGAVAVPINFFQKAGEVAYICSNVGAVAMVTQSLYLETVQSVQKEYNGLKTIWVIDQQPRPIDSQLKDFSSLLIKTSKGIETTYKEEEKTILILYTSGTSGKPKGAMLSHKNLTSNVSSCAQALNLTYKDRFMCILPMFHVFAWTTCVLVPLFLGCPITIVESVRPPKPWLKLMFKHRVTVFAAIPQIYAVLAEQAKGFKRLLLKYIFFHSVRFGVSGAAPLGHATLEKFEKKIGVPLLEGYGLTETSPVVSVNTLTAKKAGSVGKVVPQVQVRIIDQDGRDLPAGLEGEIIVQGPSVICGYYNLPSASQTAFTKGGWFKTGDIGILDSEGFLYIRDRLKDMIIVKGLKVFSIQIEEVLLSHPSVAEAAVIGIPNSEGDETIKGFVILKDGYSIAKSELLNFCKDKLPPYKRPRDIEIRKELPKNVLQKILKRELRGTESNEKI